MNREELISIRLDLIKKSFPVSSNAQIVAVTKKRPLSDILSSYEAGIRDFGENRVDELLEKAALVKEKGVDDIRWHFIGHLQKNKINKLFTVPNLFSIHSVDSFELLEILYQRSENLPNSISYFIQVNTSQEREKTGLLTEDDLMKAINLASKYEDSKLKLRGLMTMSKIRTNDFQRDAKACFKKLRNWKDLLESSFSIPPLSLSMGMSSDYQWALEEGSDYLRLGSVLYKEDQNA